MTDDAPAPTTSATRSTLSHLLSSSGFWGAVGALLGALIGGVFSFLATAMTTSAEADRSRRAFFLNERVGVYSSLLGEAQAFQLSAARYNTLVQQSEGNAAGASAALSHAMADYEDAVAASWQVEIVATSPVRAAKQSIAMELDAARDLLPAKTADAADYFRHLDRIMTDHTTEFAQAAAKELDTER